MAKKKKTKKTKKKSQKASLNGKRTKADYRKIVDLLQNALRHSNEEVSRQRALRKAHETDGMFTLEPILTGTREESPGGHPVVLRGELDQVLFVEVPEGTKPEDITSTVAAIQAMGVNRPIAAIYPGFEVFRVVPVTDVGPAPEEPATLVYANPETGERST